ncbi:alpha/beta hydrolase [Streptomyces sp. NPDC057486]|uniref:alpha/beta hydrolase n=1 Tax=Streptomyces sp. NPDC057486 TaxID=3346145 RepID=UPI0036A53D91
METTTAPAADFPARVASFTLPDSHYLARVNVLVRVQAQCSTDGMTTHSNPISHDVTTRRPRDPSRYYQVGPTPFYATRYDQRFSYGLYVPTGYARQAEEPLPLVVVMHGTGRAAEAYRDAFAEFAEQYRCLIVAPLFPAGIGDPGDLHNFKFIEYEGIRFDDILLSILDEVQERYHVAADRFSLFGFSGGGQFAHRFFYLHPDRLTAVSIGAPGRITMLDPQQRWWLGTADFEERFGRSIDLEAMRRVRVQLVVGAQDTETWEINNRGGSNWMDGADAIGRTRVERLQALSKNLDELGVANRLDLVPGVAHRGLLVIPAVQDFLASVLTEQRATAG